jgi:hypothetical protein
MIQISPIQAKFRQANARARQGSPHPTTSQVRRRRFISVCEVSVRSEEGQV